MKLYVKIDLKSRGYADLNLLLTKPGNEGH